MLENSGYMPSNEAKAHWSELLTRVDQGEQITITRHGLPIARLVPVKTKTTPDERRASIERWLEASGSFTLGGISIRELINEGRR